jgi:soluble lytic murein transglycosylase-like protein
LTKANHASPFDASVILRVAREQKSPYHIYTFPPAEEAGGFFRAKRRNDSETTPTYLARKGLMTMTRRAGRIFPASFAALLLFLFVWTLPASAQEQFFNRNSDFLYMQSLGDGKCNPKTATTIARFLRERNGSLSGQTAERYAKLITDAAKDFGVDPVLVAAIVVKESTAKANTSAHGCYGLMQIKWSAHRKSIARAFPHIKTLKDLMVPENNIRVGTYFLANHIRRYNGDIDRALDRYKGRANAKYKRTLLQFYTRMMKSYRS